MKQIRAILIGLTALVPIPAAITQTRPAVTLHSIRGLTTLIFSIVRFFTADPIALKSRTFVVKSRTTFVIMFVRNLNAKAHQWEIADEAAWA